jgi:uncharacterized protein with HEPN domain
MPPDERDAAYLWDMLDAARFVREATVDVSLADYQENRVLHRAVEHPEIPWAKIVAQRNVLAHEYGEIKQDRMWALATVKIPELLVKLESLVPPLPPADDA